MTEDVKTFTTMTLSFLLMLLNATITAAAFSRVIWLISPGLLGIAVGYAVVGSLLTMFVGRKLVGLNNLQLKKEANFRYELIHVREYADSIAILRGREEAEGPPASDGSTSWSTTSARWSRSTGTSNFSRSATTT